MPGLAEELTHLEPKHAFFIGIDSDGCVFDTMEIKQKQCFCPNNIAFFGLQAVSRYAREATEFVNLYSRQRGTNRYPAILAVLDLLSKRREVIEQGVKIPRLDRLREWVRREPTLSQSALRAEVERTGDPELRHVLAWSEAVDAAIAATVKATPPFPFVRESLEAASLRADILVVSQTPLEALQREWSAHSLARYVRAIAGQEHGTKAEHLALASRGKYAADRVLMIGDAQGDYRAARQNGACFFPIVPGDEARSWKRFLNESFDRFLTGAFRGPYEAELLRAFDAALPEQPGW